MCTSCINISCTHCTCTVDLSATLILVYAPGLTLVTYLRSVNSYRVKLKVKRLELGVRHKLYSYRVKAKVRLDQALRLKELRFG